MNAVILGAGRTGVELACQLARDGAEVSLIDKNRAAFRRVQAEGKILCVGGLGIDEDTLKKAGIEKADLFVALSGGDNTNIMASQMALHLFSVPKVICRIVDPKREAAYRKLGLTTFPSTTLTAGLLRQTIQGKTPSFSQILQELEEG